MSILIIDDEMREQCRRLRAFAEGHHYQPERDNVVPGNDPRYIAQLSSFRCVFTVTEHRGRIYRHLSISVPRRGRYPNHAAVAVIAQELGFKGELGKDYTAGPHLQEHCVVCAQEIP